MRFLSWVKGVVLDALLRLYLSPIVRDEDGIVMRRVLVMLLLAFVGLMFVINITPEIETAVASENITNAFTTALVDMSAWVLPVGAMVALFYGIFKLLKGR